MKFVQGIILLVVFVLALAFTVINADAVTLNYYLGTLELPLSVIVIGAFAMGSIVGILATLGRVMRLRRGVNCLQRSERIAQQELTNVRSLPAREETV